MDEILGIVVGIVGQLILLLLLWKIMCDPSRLRSGSGWTWSRLALAVALGVAMVGLLLAPI